MRSNLIRFYGLDLILKYLIISPSFGGRAGLLLLLMIACKKSPVAPPTLFTKLDSAKTGITFVNQVNDTDQFNILDYLYFYNGGGVATGDVNNDGLTDVYFVSNQGKNHLYLNKGNWQFEDITEAAGVEGYADWQTGVTMADVNGDGFLDIYVCAVGNYKGLEGANELYINNGDGTFIEKAADYGLDFTGFSTQAAFFDYDKDGDLDMYLLNHAVHTSRSYNRVAARGLRDNSAGDRLYRNDSPSPSPSGKGAKNSPSPSGRGLGAARFTDVSQQAGIFGPAMGYGLGISVGDFNNDGWDDMYVGNDFHEDDYYYLNNHDGTFSESLKNAFTHVSRYSMGNDAADVNNDGFLDIVTLDMYPEDEKVEKSSAGEDPFDIYLYKLAYGFFYQYSRNTLQLNMGGKKFSDVGAMAGVAATDWSWAPLLADFDNDGRKDLFVSNGIRRRPNNLDYIKYISTDSVAYGLQMSKKLDKSILERMPEGKVHNYVFRGTEQPRFEDKSTEWGFAEPTFSNGAAYADLDNDGDLDLITNNINSAADIYQNRADSLLQHRFLRVKLQGEQGNAFGIGTKVLLKTKSGWQYQHQMPTRGFISSVDPTLVFGLGKSTRIDSLLVIWPSQQMEIRTNVPVNQTLTLKQNDARQEVKLPFHPSTEPLFEDVTKTASIAYKHDENDYYDFNREWLMPFRVSTEGPALATGDVNGDGLDDFFVGGGKHQPGQLMIQSANGFTATNQPLFRADSVFEDVDAVFFDADGDGDLDLYVVSGGNEFYGKMLQQFDRLYINSPLSAGEGPGVRFTKSPLPPMYDNKSCVRPFDFDGDGNLDLFVGGRVVGYQYGKSPNSYLLVNDGKGNFSDQTDKRAPELRKAGMVTDALWMDYDQDNDADLIVCGDWMPITVYENQNGKLILTSQSLPVRQAGALRNSNGLWSALAAADFDKDGDMDLMAGNLGTNTKFRKRDDSKLRMYIKDIDSNQSLEHIVAYSVGDKWYPVANKEEMGKQLPLINRKFTSYADFAGKTIDELFTEAELKDADVREVHTFESVYLENTGNKQFKVHPLPVEAQVSKIFAFHVTDANQDGNLDVLLGGNFYGTSTYQGRYDASYGLLLKGNGKGGFTSVLPTENGFLLEGEVRKIKPLKTTTGELLLVARNDTTLQVFKPLRSLEKEGKPLTIRQ